MHSRTLTRISQLMYCDLENPEPAKEIIGDHSHITPQGSNHLSIRPTWHIHSIEGAVWQNGPGIGQTPSYVNVAHIVHVHERVTGE
jgi:hypothetical protein